MIAMHKPKIWRMSDWFMAFSLMVFAEPIALAQQSPKNFIMDDASKPVAAVRFDDDRGQERNLSDFCGEVVLLNIWATWCVPCRKEMPALDLRRSVFRMLNVVRVRSSIAPLFRRLQ